MDYLVQRAREREQQSRGLSVVFTTFCIVDLFGVFPIIALPRPVIDCGWVGLPLALAVFTVQIYTAMLLGKCWTMAEHLDPDIVCKSRYPYTALVEMAMGRGLGRAVTFLLDVTVLTAGVPNLMVAAQNLQILGIKTAGGQLEVSFCYWIFILGVILCPIMWLGSPKDMKWLAVSSMVTVVSVSLLTWYCMFTDPSAPGPGTVPQPSFEATAIAFGILAFQFDIHPTVLSVQMDMERKSQLGVPIVAAFLLTGTLFSITTMCGLLRYGNTAMFNLLQGLPGTAPLYLDLTLVTAQIFLSMVIGSSALFQDVEDKLRIPREFNLRRCALRSGFVAVIVALGFSVPRFDLVMGLIGGALTGPLMFLLPPLLYLKFRRLLHEERLLQGWRRATKRRDSILLTYRDYQTFEGEDKSVQSGGESGGEWGELEGGWSWGLRSLVSFEACLRGEAPSLLDRAVCHGIVLMGVLATVAATFFSIKSTVSYAQFTPSCVMNFTAATTLLDLYSTTD